MSETLTKEKNTARVKFPDGDILTFVQGQEDFFGDYFWAPEHPCDGKVYWELEDVESLCGGGVEVISVHYNGEDMSLDKYITMQ